MTAHIRMEEADSKHRYVCSKCGERGRLLRDPDNARGYGEAHALVCYDLDWGATVTVAAAAVDVEHPEFHTPPSRPLPEPELPLSMQPGWDPTTPGREAEAAYLDACIREGVDPETGR